MEKKYDKDLGRRVKELRIQMNLTQRQVAEALHVTPGFISNVENGRTAMSLRILIYYSKLAGITLDSLVGRMEPTYRETALNNELMSLISEMSTEEKQNLLATIRIWRADA